MTKTAIFMGAGASAPLGYPLTSRLLPLIKARLDDQTLFAGDSEKKEPELRQELSAYLNALMPGFDTQKIPRPSWFKDEETIEFPIITDVLSQIDYALAVSNSPLRLKSNRELLRFRTLLERAILEVLKRDPKNEKIHKSAFADWVRKQKDGPADTVGVVSTNYDLSLESELFSTYANSSQKIAGEFDFGFSWRDTDTGVIHHRPESPSFQFFKLHGSLNWLRCELCEHIYINTGGKITDWAFRQSISPSNTCHCSHAILRSVIIAPSLVRDVRDANLLEIWKNALELLRTASKWVIIGYSFPPEDIAIRSLFIRALQGRWAKPKIKVVQYGQNKATYSTYHRFLPLSKDDYMCDGLEGLLSS